MDNLELLDGIVATVHAIKTEEDFDFALITLLKKANVAGFGRDILIARVDLDNVSRPV